MTCEACNDTGRVPCEFYETKDVGCDHNGEKPCPPGADDDCTVPCPDCCDSSCDRYVDDDCPWTVQVMELYAEIASLKASRHEWKHRWAWLHKAMSVTRSERERALEAKLARVMREAP